MRTTIRFDEVKIRGVRHWKGEDGKRHQETKVFMQTVNPWNRNTLGLCKSRSEIMDELIGERSAWLASHPKIDERKEHGGKR